MNEQPGPRAAFGLLDPTGPPAEAGAAIRAEDWRREGVALAAGSGLPVLDLSRDDAGDPPPRPGAPFEAAVTGADGADLRAAAAFRLRRDFGVPVASDDVSTCVGATEFIVTLPLFLRRLRPPGPCDTVLVPALGSSPYVYGAELAGLRVVRVPAGADFRMRLDALDPSDVRRALCLWVNSPVNPTGVLEPLAGIARWGRCNGVLVVSDEAYAAATWDGRPRTVLSAGPQGVLAMHSLSQRSGSPQVRAGFYAGDPELVAALADLRGRAGFLPGAADQATAVRLLRDDRHAAAHRVRSRRRVHGLLEAVWEAGLRCARPQGGPFLWVRVPHGTDLAFARRAAATAGVVVMPGRCFGPAGGSHVRISATHDPGPVAARLALLRSPDTGGVRQRKVS